MTFNTREEVIVIKRLTKSFLRYAERFTTADYPLILLKDELDPSLLQVGTTLQFRSHATPCLDDDCTRVATIVKGAEYDKGRDAVFVTVVYPQGKFPLKQERMRVAVRGSWGMWRTTVHAVVLVVIPQASIADGDDSAPVIPEAS